MELGIKKARKYKEVQLYWVIGATNPANLFTKEENDDKHYKILQDQMVTSREAFATPLSSSNILNKANVQTIDSNPGILWGLLERELVDQNFEELTPLTKSKSLT